MQAERMTVKCSDYYDGLLSIPREMVLCVDTETTGLDPKKDEILQVGIVDGNCNVVLNTYIRPDHRRRWPKAQEMSGISWSTVKDAPEMWEVRNEIERTIADAKLVVGYNVGFDVSMLEEAGINIDESKTYDVMEDCSRVWGKWSDKKGGYLWMKLAEAARRFGIELDAHDAVNDATATMKIFYTMLSRWEFVEAERKSDELRESSIRLKQEAAEVERKKEIGGYVRVLTAFVVAIASILLLFYGCSSIFA